MFPVKRTLQERESLDSTTIDNYYNTAEEVRGLTSTLYGLPWAGYENRAMDAIAEVMSGNEYAGGNDDPPFSNFSSLPLLCVLPMPWKAFYKIGGWTSTYMNGLELKKSKREMFSWILPLLNAIS